MRKLVDLRTEEERLRLIEEREARLKTHVSKCDIIFKSAVDLYEVVNHYYDNFKEE